MWQAVGVGGGRGAEGHSHLGSSSWLPSPPSSSVASAMAGGRVPRVVAAVRIGWTLPPGLPAGSGVDGISFTVHPEYLRETFIPQPTVEIQQPAPYSNEPSSRGSRSLGCRRRRRCPIRTRRQRRAVAALDVAASPRLSFPFVAALDIAASSIPLVAASPKLLPAPAPSMAFRRGGVHRDPFPGHRPAWCSGAAAYTRPDTAASKTVSYLELDPKNKTKSKVRWT